MAYVTVPKDLTRVKSKIVFGLTKRQLICFGGALLVGVPLYFLLRGRVTGSAAALIIPCTALTTKRSTADSWTIRSILCRRPATKFFPG